MSQSKFKVGDKVVCVEALGSGEALVEGGIYTVESLYNDDDLRLKGMPNKSWYSDRFKLVVKEGGGVFVDAEAAVGLNPKSLNGAVSLPMTSVSPLLCAHISLAKYNGKGRYGGSNFIGTEVTLSTYLDAIQRHLDKFKMGEVVDEVDGVHHFGAIGANLDIILCAQAAGTLVDDRLRCDGQLEAYKALTPMVKKLNDLHKDKKPKHYYMKDKEKGSAV